MHLHRTNPPVRHHLACFCLAGIFLASDPVSVAAQDTRSPEPSASPQTEWVAITGPHIDYQSFVTDLSLLESRESLLQDKALDHLENAIRQGKTSPEDPNLIHLIERISLTPSIVVAAPGTNLAPSQPAVRAKGIQLLALLGGNQARELLRDIVFAEEDPAVLTEAYHGLRLLEVPIDTSQIACLVRHLRDPFPNGPNDGLVQEILRFIQSARESNGSLVNRELFDTIMAVNQNRRYLQQTNDLALKTLKQLMGMN